MSLVTQIGGSDPDDLWRMAALPVALALDLALGDLPGRTYPVVWLRWLTAVVEDGLRRTVARLGGGRGGDLFCGVFLGVMVVTSVAGIVWLVVDVGDTIGGPAVLAVRAGVIAAGLIIRATCDPILNAVETTDRATAARWFERLGGVRPPWLDRLGAIPVGLTAAGELLSSRIVAPLFWLAIGGPAALWGFIAVRSLRESMLARGERSDLAVQVLVGMADAAEAIPAALAVGFIVGAAAVIRADPAGAGGEAWRFVRSSPRSLLLAPRAALAGALGVAVAGGRVFAGGPPAAITWLGPTNPPPTELSVIRAVRIMQLGALGAAGIVTLLAVVR